MNKFSRNKYDSPIDSNVLFEGISQSVPWFRCLNVGQKIAFGYGVAISVGVLGTIMGTFIGDYYQYEAIKAERRVDEEVELLNEVKSAILQARIHQQHFISLLEKPKDLQEKYIDFLKYVDDAKEGWDEIESFSEEIVAEYPKHSQEIIDLITTYDGVLQAYFIQVDKLIKQIDASNRKSPEEIQGLILLPMLNKIIFYFDGKNQSKI